MMKRAALLLITLCLLCCQSAQAEVYTVAPPADNWYQRPLLRLTAFPTGASDCLLLECGGEAMLVDAGLKSYTDTLRKTLRSRKLTTFKYFLNTHFHDDHIGGFGGLMLGGILPEEYLHPYNDFAELISASHAATLKAAREMKVPIRKAENGDLLLLGEAAITLYRFDEGETTNGKSMIEHIQFGDATALLCADITGVTQLHFAKTLPEDVLKVDVMKMPHHGITALNKTFMAKTQPAVLIVTNWPNSARQTFIQATSNGMLPYSSTENTTVAETDGTDWYVYQLEGFQ